MRCKPHLTSCPSLTGTVSPAARQRCDYGKAGRFAARTKSTEMQKDAGPQPRGAGSIPAGSVMDTTTTPWYVIDVTDENNPFVRGVRKSEERAATLAKELTKYNLTLVVAKGVGIVRRVSILDSLGRDACVP